MSTLPPSQVVPSELAAVPGATSGMIATAQATQTYQMQQAQLRDVRNAEARVNLARARLDFSTVRNKGVGDGDVREFLDARQSLRRLRNVYGPKDTGYEETFYRPFGPFGRHWPRHDRWGYDGPDKIADSPNLTIGGALPLSSLRR
ncbi:MAG: hypothetical protein ACSHX3_13855 [Litorimonas sp.]